MEFTKLEAPSLRHLFIKQVQEKILSNELPVGSALPSERKLSEQMKVSRAVINGGIADLAKQGFLEIRPRQGAFVADYRRTGNIDTLVAIMEYQGGVLGQQEVISILEVRLAIEQLSAKKAIENATDEVMGQLHNIAVQFDQVSSAQQAAELAFEFHHELTIAGGNIILPLIYYSFKTPVTEL